MLCSSVVVFHRRLFSPQSIPFRVTCADDRSRAAIHPGSPSQKNVTGLRHCGFAKGAPSMKKYAAFLVLFLTFVPSFASRIQPSQFSQFHVHRSRLSHKTISTPDLEAHSRRPVAPTTAAPANLSATKQQLKALFKRRTQGAAATIVVANDESGGLSVPLPRMLRPREAIT
jgi:hypothetical protein